MAFDTYVVDNASDDGVSFVESNYPDVRLIRNGPTSALPMRLQPRPARGQGYAVLVLLNQIRKCAPTGWLAWSPR